MWLLQRQMQPYWPRYNPVPRAYQPRNRIVWRSVLPGYMFVNAKRIKFWLFDELDGAKLMRNGNSLVEIPDAGKQGMERIREIAEALNADAIAARDGIPFKVGQKVRIRDLDIEATVKRLDSRRRIVVAAPMLGSVVDMTVAVEHIESI